MIAGYLSGLMSSALILLQTESGTHELDCPVGETLDIGSAANGAVQIDGEGILPCHLTLRRLSEDRFAMVCTSRDVPAWVNGVCASELEVTMPFRLTLAGEDFDFSLPEADGPASSAERRRDYLITPVSRLRVAPVPPVVPTRYPPPVEKRAASRPLPPPPESSRFDVDHASTWMILFGIASAVGAGVFVWFWLGYSATKVAEPRPRPAAQPVEPPPPDLRKPAPVAVIAPPPPQVEKAVLPAVDESAEALKALRMFLESWSAPEAAEVLSQVIPAPENYFGVEKPDAEALVKLEETFRTHWPVRRITWKGDGSAQKQADGEIRAAQDFSFELRHETCIVRGSGTVKAALRRHESGGWRCTQVTDVIQVAEALPSVAAYADQKSLRALRPALSEVEQLQAHMQSGENAAALTLILRAADQEPQAAAWRVAGDKVCSALARELFATGALKEPVCIEGVKKLSALGVVSAQLLHGHLLRAGHGVVRSIAGGEQLYREAYESSKAREARFYYAEALFLGGEHEKASAIALAVMAGSQHPLECYLAAHLLWRKAELDPALWQQVYEIAARGATQHPPAKNLAGLVLLKHGETRTERAAGFKLIREAAEAGVTEAMKNLAACYEHGDGCEADTAEAARWKNLALTSPPLPKRHYGEW